MKLISLTNHSTSQPKVIQMQPCDSMASAGLRKICFKGQDPVDLLDLGPTPKTMTQILCHEPVQLAWREYGNPNSNHVMICLHGFTRNSLDFDPLARYLVQHQPDCRIICPDIVGRGQSGRFTTNGVIKYNFLTYDEQLTKLFDHLHLKAPQKDLTIIGTSMGGILGLQMAALHRFPIKRLIMNDVGPSMSDDMLNELAEMMAGDDKLSFKDMEAVKQYITKRFGGFGALDETQLDHIAKSTVRYDPESATYKLNYDPEVTALFRQYLSMTKYTLPFFKPYLDLSTDFFMKTWGSLPLWAEWQSLRIPVLILRGEHSPILTANTVDRMLQSSGGRASCITIPNCGHAPSLMTTDQEELVSHWLDQTIHQEN